MTLQQFIKDRHLYYIGQAFYMLLLSIFLFVMGNSRDVISIILITWIVILMTNGGLHFYKRKKYFQNICYTLDRLDKKYLIAEIETPGYSLEDQLYWEILRRSNKSVIERIHSLEDEKKEYREYIESWVHEIKLPVTALELMAENQNAKDKTRFQEELEKIDCYVEQVLFYARSDSVYQDFLIQETDITQVINKVLAKNKKLLIQNRVACEVETGKMPVLGDKKWLAFILQQIIINAVKYKDLKKTSCHIRFYKEEKNEQTILVIEDNGIGISKEDIGRIFQKGFTGHNGRQNREEHPAAATGIGLYLCKKLCEKTDIKILAESQEGQYTRILLVFSKGTYLTKL